jgi:hypothetical protein
MQICILRRTALHISLHVQDAYCTGWKHHPLRYFSSAALDGQKLLVRLYVKLKAYGEWTYTSTYPFPLHCDRMNPLSISHSVNIVTTFVNWAITAVSIHFLRNVAFTSIGKCWVRIPAGGRLAGLELLVVLSFGVIHADGQIGWNMWLIDGLFQWSVYVCMISRQDV